MRANFEQAILSSTLVIALGLAACSGENEPEPVPTQDPNAAYYLPPIEEEWAQETGDGILMLEQRAKVEYESGAPIKEFSDLPPAYDAAFYNMLNNPVVKQATELGVVDKIVVSEAELDNGYFQPEDESITLEISDGQKPDADRIYFDERIFTSVGVHEAGHAFSKAWFEFMESGNKPADPVLAEKLESVAATCRGMRDDIFRDFISAYREEVAQSFEETGEGFSRLELSDNEIYEPGELETRAEYMHTTADAVREDDPNIYNSLQISTNTACEALSVFTIPYDLPEVDGEKLGVFAEFAETEPLNVMQSKLRTEYYDHYVCLNDGRAMKDLLHKDHDIIGGHSYDNPTEASASVVAILAMNPGFIQSCVEKLPEEEREKINALAASVWDATIYMHPKLATVIDQLPGTQEAITNFS